jgi:nicotinamidase-related amidase
MKVIVLVDLQNDFIDGSLGSPEAQAIVPKVCERVIQIAQENNEAPLVLYTKDTQYENYLDTQEG